MNGIDQICKSALLYMWAVFQSKTLIATLGALTFLSFCAAIGAWGVISDLEQSLKEMKSLEERELLADPPKTTSKNTLYEISQFKNSAELDPYITGHIQSATTFSH
jgi:hypothetical protein